MIDKKPLVVSKGFCPNCGHKIEVSPNGGFYCRLRFTGCGMMGYVNNIARMDGKKYDYTKPIDTGEGP